MEIPQSAGYFRRNRRRLVIPWILLFCLLSYNLFPQNPSKSQAISYEDAGRLPPLYEEEILSQTQTDIYKNPFIYLCFLPGFIVFIILLLIKKKRISSLVFLFFGLCFLLYPVPGSLIEQGVDVFLSGDYAGALKMFKQSEEFIGPLKGLCYNNALCYYHLDKKGYAIFELYRARKKAPMDRRFIHALRLIEEEAGLTSQINTIPFIHPDIPFIIMMALFNISCIFLGLVFRFKKGSFVIIFVLLTLCTIGALVVFITTQFQLQEKICVVISQNGMLKQIPLPSSRTWVLLKEGASIKVLGNAKGYYLVKTGRGLNGWIREADVKVE